MLVCLKDGKRIELDPSTILNKNKKIDIKSSSTEMSSSYSSSSSLSNFSFDDELLDDSIQVPDSNKLDSSLAQEEQKQKKKRQRLTHLTADEKMMRRKLKNRVAAQSARDRKKVKMEDLENTCDFLKEQNEILKKENSILKEKAKILLDENRKLLKFKQEHQQQQTANKKRKLDNVEHCVEVEGSAVSNSRVSLPQKLLQTSMFQKLICVLMILGLNVNKMDQVKQKTHSRVVQGPSSCLQTIFTSSMDRRQRVQLTILKLIKLFGLIRNRRAQMNYELKNCLNSNSHPSHRAKLNLSLLVPLIIKLLMKKRTS